MRTALSAIVVVATSLSACGGAETSIVPDNLAGSDGVVEFGELSRDHVETDVAYDHAPPVGGAHQPVWQTCGFYSTAIPDERGVHSMEHGAVWITFDPALPDDEITVIEGLADGEREVLASPYDGLPSPVVASAWGLQLQLDAADDQRLIQFVDFYENGPQTPEPDTPCAGGVSDSSE